MECIPQNTFTTTGKHMNPPKILVVDDDLTICELFTTFLEIHGFDAKFVVNGEQALATLDKENFRAVITDLKMGKVDGHAVVRHAKKIGPETTLIMMTGYCGEESRQQALDNGADYFFCKPVPMKELLRTLPAPTGTARVNAAGPSTS